MTRTVAARDLRLSSTKGLRASDPATSRELVDIAGTHFFPGFADASARHCVSRHLLDLQRTRRKYLDDNKLSVPFIVGEAGSHRENARPKRVQSNKDPRSVGGSHSVRKPTSTTTGADRRWP